MTIRGASIARNKYRLSDIDHAGDNYDITTKKRLYPTIDAGTGVFVTIGQSRIANNSSSPATPYTPTNGVKCLNLNPYDGHYYVLQDPVLGCSASVGYLNAGWQARLADRLINAGKYTKVVIIPIAIAGSSISEWNPSSGAYSDRLRAASALLTDKGITPTAWLCQIGTTDNINGMSQSDFQTYMRAAINFQRSQPGRANDKWMIAQDTVASGVTSSAIRAAQAAVATDAKNYLGPDCDTVPSGDMDTLHYNDTGNDFVAGLWDVAIRGAF